RRSNVRRISEAKSECGTRPWIPTTSLVTFLPRPAFLSSKAPPAESLAVLRRLARQFSTVRFWQKQRRTCGKRAPFPIKLGNHGRLLFPGLKLCKPTLSVHKCPFPELTRK